MRLFFFLRATLKKYDAFYLSISLLCFKKKEFLCVLRQRKVEQNQWTIHTANELKTTEDGGGFGNNVNRFRRTSLKWTNFPFSHHRLCLNHPFFFGNDYDVGGNRVANAMKPLRWIAKYDIDIPVNASPSLHHQRLRFEMMMKKKKDTKQGKPIKNLSESNFRDTRSEILFVLGVYLKTLIH